MARNCPECQAPVRREPGARGGTKHFCCNEHKVAYQARQAKEGRAIIAIAKAWRMSRNSPANKETGSQAFAELCRMLDGFNAEDRAEGRAPAVDYVRTLFSDGRLYIDRRR